jgi:ribonucleotide reductase beta subunit family protein with ferritin-like domain
MACVEGIFFSGCFCAIYWLANRGLMPGLAHSNELIARDEGLHTLFATILYNMIRPELKLSAAEATEIISEAVEISKEFINAALPIELPEMNSRLMSQYIETVADNLLALIKLPKVYNAKQPFKFMDQLNMIGKTNFFERYVSEYQKIPVADTDDFEVSENF